MNEKFTVDDIQAVDRAAHPYIKWAVGIFFGAKGAAYCEVLYQLVQNRTLLEFVVRMLDNDGKLPTTVQVPPISK